MANLREIRNRIESVENTKQVTRAMKMVAAAKLRRAQERIFQTRPYAYKIGELISHLKAELSPTSHPFFQAPEDSTGTLVILVTADRGLCGGFNSNVIKAAEGLIEDQYPEKHEAGDLYMLCIGEKGHTHFQEEFDLNDRPENGQAIDYIFEPNPRGLLDELVPRYLYYQMWRALLESNAAEQGARMVAMDNATTNAEEVIEDLTLQYNRARQSAITMELLDIASGAEALEDG